MSSSLFEEAIADAKKIREVAEENAKKAVLEAVTPKIREFIESQIFEEKEEADEPKKEGHCSMTSEGHCSSSHTKNEDAGKKCTKCGGEIKSNDSSKEEAVQLDETAIKELMKLVGGNLNIDKLGNGATNAVMSEAFSKLTNRERKKILRMAKKIDGQNNNLKSRDLYRLKEHKNMSTEKYYEVDLQSLREALKDDGPMGEEYPNPMSEFINEEDEEMEMPDMGGEDDLLADEMADEESDEAMISRDEVERQIQELIDDLGLDLGEDGMGAMEDEADMEALDLGELEDEEDEEAEQLDEVFDIDPRMLRKELKRIKRLSEASEKGLAHETGGIAKDYEHHFGGKGSANSKGGDFGGGKPGKDVLAEMKYALRNQRRQNTSLQNKLTKYRGAVNTLREQLEELNLFNAKLLYVNKLLQNKQISESQKRSIVQALDEAKDLREAKVLYKSLTESFTQTKSSNRGTLTESVRYGGSSRTTRSASSQQATGEVNRWARLAGLK
jgi:hypothetical protein